MLDTVHITRAAGGRHYQVASDLICIKAGGAETSGRLLLLDVRVPTGGGPPVIHRHEYAEVFYILESEFEIITVSPEGDARTVGRVAPGDSVAIPSWAWHNFRNVGGVPGRLLAVHSDARMEEFAREVGVPVADPDAPSPPMSLSPEGRERLMAAVGRYMEAWTPGAPRTPTPAP